MEIRKCLAGRVAEKYTVRAYARTHERIQILAGQVNGKIGINWFYDVTALLLLLQWFFVQEKKEKEEEQVEPSAEMEVR